MPDIGGMELLVIGIVALIVVGPKDLPGMFKKLGQMVARVRAMGREFTNAMNAAADDTGMSEMNRDLRAATKFTNPKAMAKEMMGDVMDDIDPSKYEEGSATRVVAEKKAAAQKDAREMAAKAREIRAAKAAEAAELSGEPDEEAVAAAEPAAVDPGPADIEAADTAEPQANRP
ncbi:Sec-independent protein translocase protein TatB [Jannaschia sp. CCS1]|uniref:Sec-independent protein translocase protein TatB n=1 Tax=Jannaschia sp. (strain CCS1) TaxID=290400 RepID=UPI000053D68A|nr:Sec-independent protein translocase protein TatB [Jannaschia sp. CCS1]ABD54127.1 twin-arginine translocation protein TatB [Jannaschia sp. CCS1]